MQNKDSKLKEEKINKHHKIHHDHNYYTFHHNDSNNTEHDILDDFFEIKLNFYLKSALIGVARGAIGLIWEHPLDSIKTQWQTNIQVVKSTEMIDCIYKEKGVLGFYRGFLPNLIRQSSKNIYRWPLMLYLPKYFKKIFENYFSKTKLNNDSFCKVLTGFTIANLETLFICPLERIKVFFMTHVNEQKKNYSYLKQFYILYKGNLIKQLFKGLEPSIIRSNISWISFLYLDHKTRTFLKKRRNVNELDIYDVVFASLVVGIGNLSLSN